GFGVLPAPDHGSIVSEVDARAESEVAALVLRALKTRTAASFGKLCDDLEEITRRTYASTGKETFQQFILHAVDEYGMSIPDFTVEFFVLAADKQEDNNTITRRPTKKESDLSDEVNRLLLS